MASKSDIDDADGIVLEAGGELFTVARCRLVQDSPLFRDMFVLASSDSSGKKDGTLESPIHTGDEADMFRDFLWALRVRPGELVDFIDSPAKPEKAVKLTNIACLAHKYQDVGLADWALRQLHRTLSPSWLALDDSVLKPLLRTLALFNDDAERVRPIHVLLCSRVEAAKSADATLIDLVGLIEACTTSGYSSLLPTAYYALLVAPKDLDWLDDVRLTESNKRQLLRGAYRLSEDWHKLSSRCPPSLEQKLPHSVRTRPADLLCKLQSIPPYTPQSKHNRNSYYSSTYGYEDDGSHPSSERERCTLWRAEVDSLIEAFPQKLGEYFDLEKTPAATRSESG